ncbi:MAG: hypothetical protein ACRDLF_08285 [Solirubrobacteraceae bacterium]
MMSKSADRIVTVPADLVDAVRTGLHSEENAALHALGLNRLVDGQPPEPGRYERLEGVRGLLAVIGRERRATPVAVRVDLDEHRLPLLAALHCKLEDDARGLSKPDASRYAQERTRVVARLDALGEYISNIEAIGGARDDAERQLQDQLDAQLECALDALGYDEERGDWWRVTHDGGEDGWWIKGAIDGKDVNIDVTVTGYSVS